MQWETNMAVFFFVLMYHWKFSHLYNSWVGSDHRFSLSSIIYKYVGNGTRHYTPIQQSLRGYAGITLFII